MGLLALCEDSPAFATSTELSAALLDIMRVNIEAMHMASYLGRNAFEWRWGERPENTQVNPCTVWRGAFRFLTGMTTLTITLNNSGLAAGDVLRVYLNGAGTATTLTAGAQSVTRTISGYADGEIVELDLILYNAGRTADTAAWGTTEIRDITLTPVGLPDAYPGVPSFGAITAANLNQLSDATDWIMRWMGLLHAPLFCAILRENGPFGPATPELGQQTVSWRGSIRRTAEHTTLKAKVGVLILYPGYTESIVLKVNGATVATYSVPSTAGETNYTFSTTLATTVDAVVDLEIQMLRTAPDPELDTPLVNRISLYRVWLERATTPTAAGLTACTARESLTFSALQTRLNAYGTALTAIKARLDANPDIWARQRPYRRRHSFDDFQAAFFEPSRPSYSAARVGEALAVAGKGVSLHYGPFSYAEKPGLEDGLYAVTTLRNETLIDGAQAAAALHWLDTFAGLAPGTGYLVRGDDLRYAAEQLLVTRYGT